MSDTPKTPVVLSYGINDISVETDAELAERIASMERRARLAEAKLKVALECLATAQDALERMEEFTNIGSAWELAETTLEQLDAQDKSLAALDQIGKESHE